jgi:four helix bundle protein
MMSFEDLEVWKRGVELSAGIYAGLKQLRDYGFREQISKSGLSIPSNIAEGFERASQKEAITFLSYAKGSSGELRTQIIIGMRIGYIPEEMGKDWIQETREISSMLGGLIKKKRSFVEKARNVLLFLIG